MAGDLRGGGGQDAPAARLIQPRHARYAPPRKFRDEECGQAAARGIGRSIPRTTGSINSRGWAPAGIDGSGSNSDMPGSCSCLRRGPAHPITPEPYCGTAHCPRSLYWRHAKGSVQRALSIVPKPLNPLDISEDGLRRSGSASGRRSRQTSAADRPPPARSSRGCQFQIPERWH